MRFYFSRTFGGEKRAFALVSPYSPPNDYLGKISHNTLIACMYQGDELLSVIDVKSIISVVAMVPFPYTINGCDNYYFMVEKVGLDVADVESHEDTE